MQRLTWRVSAVLIASTCLVFQEAEGQTVPPTLYASNGVKDPEKINPSRYSSELLTSKLPEGGEVLSFTYQFGLGKGSPPRIGVWSAAAIRPTFFSTNQHPEGDMPRAAAFTPDGKYVLVANRDSSNVDVLKSPHIKRWLRFPLAYTR